MYKVFFNESRLIITGHPGKEFLNKDEEFVQCLNPDELTDCIGPFLRQEIPNLTVHGDKGQLWSRFQELFLQIPAAGGVVRSDEGYLFICRRGRWDLPKGKIDAGENPEAAAVREVHEETGLQACQLVGRLPDSWHIYRDPRQASGKMILKKTYWFYMEAATGQPLHPEIAEDITEVRWVKPSELADIRTNTFRSLSEIIDKLPV